MEGRGKSKILCSKCRLQLWVTPNAQTIRCQSCRAITPVRASNQLSLTHERSCQMQGSPVKHDCSAHHVFTSLLYNLTSILDPNSSLPKKRALLCGVSYKNMRKYRLKGSINDVTSMKKVLIESFKFPVDSIRILSEEENDPGRCPTRKNIQNALRWLVDGCQSGDSLVFYFSGHGLRQPDFDNDELDGFDETICPVDFRDEGMILDNELNKILVRPLPAGVTLHAIVDSCHSGTILDLPNVYDQKSNQWIDHSPPSKANKGTNGGLAISLSACEDNQQAADTDAFQRKTMSGALTQAFIQTIKTKPELTYYELLMSIHNAIEEAKKKGSLFNSHLLGKMFNRKIVQARFCLPFSDPQLSSSVQFDPKSTKFRL
ncbi:hypothetical protein RJ641_013288 [Dillenia turbinata]|uniref:Peptidase C14 caspase domain-containing protein n=1 Tax=Dillenia turbinata TaxID=194707 RepID=A0AAN8W3Z9_9MAGN